MIDFDANLLHDAYEGKIETIISDAVAADIIGLVVPGCSIVTSMRSLELSKNYGNLAIYSTCGVHPYYTRDNVFDDNSTLLESMIVSHAEVCHAIGEAGLDYTDDFPDKLHQLPWFKYQVSLAIKHNKPLYLHVRQSDDDFKHVLTSFGWQYNSKNISLPSVVVHCFTGTTDDLISYISMNFYISLSGYIFKLDDATLSHWLTVLPSNRLLLETDAPYMGWNGCRARQSSKRNAKYPNIPSALPLIVERVAAITGSTIDAIIKMTTDNAHAYFSNKAST